MSIKTEADERLQGAYNHVSAALKDVSCVIVDQCSGHNDFTPEARKKIRDAFAVLTDLRDELETFDKGYTVRQPGEW